MRRLEPNGAQREPPTHRRFAAPPALPGSRMAHPALFRPRCRPPARTPTPTVQEAAVRAPNANGPRRRCHAGRDAAAIVRIAGRDRLR
jgi:hypothetical protein